MSSASSLKPLQTISIAASLPFLFIMLAMCPALVKELRKEKVFSTVSNKESVK